MYGKYDYDVLCSKYDYCRRVSDVCFRDTAFDKVFNDMMWFLTEVISLYWFCVVVFLYFLVLLFVCVHSTGSTFFLLLS